MASDSKVISLSAFKAKKEGLTSDLIAQKFAMPAEPTTVASKIKERRSKPRIKYHFSQRPMIFVDDIAFRVINVSQMGVKIIVPAAHLPEADSIVNGFLYLGVSNKFQFSAKVVRVIGDLVILQFEEPIPSEQFQHEMSRIADNSPPG